MSAWRRIAPVKPRAARSDGGARPLLAVPRSCPCSAAGRLSARARLCPEKDGSVLCDNRQSTISEFVHHRHRSKTHVADDVVANHRFTACLHSMRSPRICFWIASSFSNRVSGFVVDASDLLPRDGHDGPGMEYTALRVRESPVRPQEPGQARCADAVMAALRHTAKVLRRSKNRFESPMDDSSKIGLGNQVCA